MLFRRGLTILPPFKPMAGRPPFDLEKHPSYVLGVESHWDVRAVDYLGDIPLLGWIVYGILIIELRGSHLFLNASPFI